MTVNTPHQRQGVNLCWKNWKTWKIFQKTAWKTWKYMPFIISVLEKLIFQNSVFYKLLFFDLEECLKVLSSILT